MKSRELSAALDFSSRSSIMLDLRWSSTASEDRNRAPRQLCCFCTVNYTLKPHHVFEIISPILMRITKYFKDDVNLSESAPAVWWSPIPTSTLTFFFKCFSRCRILRKPVCSWNSIIVMAGYHDFIICCSRLSLTKRGLGNFRTGL